MALVSHLDLIRLFDRAVRRAALPVSLQVDFILVFLLLRHCLWE